MNAFVPVIVWMVSIIICHLIATRRGVRPNLFWRLFVIILGPLAIPFVFFIKPDRED